MSNAENHSAGGLSVQARHCHAPHSLTPSRGPPGSPQHSHQTEGSVPLARYGSGGKKLLPAMIPVPARCSFHAWSRTARTLPHKGAIQEKENGFGVSQSLATDMSTFW